MSKDGSRKKEWFQKSGNGVHHDFAHSVENPPHFLA